MSKFQISAKHPIYGTVLFTFEADDDKLAFARWKQIVANYRQWILRENTQVSGEPKKELTPLGALQASMDRHLEDERDL